MPTPTKPTALLSERRARDRKNAELEFPEGAPPCPSVLSKEAKAEWKRCVKLLNEVGILQKSDLAPLASYCRCWGEWLTLTKLSATWDYGEESDRKQSRLLGQLETRLAGLAAMFGFSAQARARIAMPILDPEDDPALAAERDAWRAKGGTFKGGCRAAVWDHEAAKLRMPPPPWATVVGGSGVPPKPNEDTTDDDDDEEIDSSSDDSDSSDTQASGA